MNHFFSAEGYLSYGKPRCIGRAPFPLARGERDARAADQRFAGTTCTRMGIALKGPPLPSVGVTSAIPGAHPSGVPSARPIRLSCRIVGAGEGERMMHAYWYERIRGTFQEKKRETANQGLSPVREASLHRAAALFPLACGERDARAAYQRIPPTTMARNLIIFSGSSCQLVERMTLP